MYKVCPKCQAPVVDSFQCQSCQLIFSKYEEISIFKQKIKAGHEIDNQEVLELDNLKNLKYALPSVFISGFVITNSFLNFFVNMFNVWLHELGHAFMAWMSGIRATPLHFGTSGFTSIENYERSGAVFLCFCFLMSFIFLKGKKHKSSYLRFIAVLFVLLSIYLTWISPEARVEELFIFGGQAGEIFFGCLCVISFYYHLPAKLYWNNFFRWPALIVGMLVLMASTFKWIKAYRHNSFRHFGQNFEEAYGDLNRLIVDFNWSQSTFFKAYLGLCLFAWILIIAHYVYFLKRHMTNINKREKDFRIN